MDARLKVLNCVSGPENQAGFEVVAAVATHAARDVAGIGMELWVPGAGDAFAGVPNRAAGAGRAGIVGRVLALRRLLLAERFAVVHCHDMPAARALALARTITEIPPAIYSVYVSFPKRSPGKPICDARTRAFLWSLRRAFSCAVAPSAFAREMAIAEGGFDPTRVATILYGVEPYETPPPEPRQAAPLRVALLPAQLERGRRRAALSYFLQAAKVVLRQTAEVVFVISIESEDVEYTGTTLGALGIADNVKALPPLSLFQALSASDVAVLATGDFQGVRPVVHAMAAGKAIIAPDLPGVREFVEPGITGLLVRPSDLQELAHSIIRLASNASERARLASAAAARARLNLTAGRMAAELTDLYRRLAATGHP